MPITVTLQLRPARPWRPDNRQVHGLACKLFEAPTGDHHRQAKQFTVWPVTPDPNDPHVGLVLRLTWLRDEPLPFTPTVGSRLRLGAVACTIRAVEEHKTSYAELASSPLATAATLAFHSPTYFAHNGQDQLSPEPRLIVGSYRRRWNQAQLPGSPLQIDDDLWQQLHTTLRLRAFDLQTAEMDSGHHHPQTGFIGQATLQLAAEVPTELRAIFSTLVRFSSFAGTGAQTTHGFGATTGNLNNPA
jgi:CRISPR/Cas system endoribonuclease Cas6 (RAMP superfamily)